jgi:hypothetical protein
MKLMLPALVLVLIGLAAGTMIRPVEAQSATSPYPVGQRLLLGYTDRSPECTVVEVRGAFVRCDPGKPDVFQPRSEIAATWYNTASTVFIAVREK